MSQEPVAFTTEPVATEQAPEAVVEGVSKQALPFTQGSDQPWERLPRAIAYPEPVMVDLEETPTDIDESKICGCMNIVTAADILMVLNILLMMVSSAIAGAVWAVLVFLCVNVFDKKPSALTQRTRKTSGYPAPVKSFSL